mgnify:CR=1 FL=1
MTDQQNSTPSPARTPAADTGGFMHPERIIAKLEIKPGMVIADFGAGGGYFTIPAARLAGENGKVYAIDVQKQTVSMIGSKANLEHLLNVETVWADLERPQGSRLQAESVDAVIVANILFQAEAKREVLAEAFRVAKSGGRLAILEWDETSFPAGPPPEKRMAKGLARRMAEGVGFKLEKEFEAGSHHYGLLFKK